MLHHFYLFVCWANFASTNPNLSGLLPLLIKASFVRQKATFHLKFRLLGNQKQRTYFPGISCASSLTNKQSFCSVTMAALTITNPAAIAPELVFSCLLCTINAKNHLQR
jgi:hypothetical protein